VHKTVDVMLKLGIGPQRTDRFSAAKEIEEGWLWCLVENAILSLNLTVCPDDVANEEIEWLGVKVLIEKWDGYKITFK